MVSIVITTYKREPRMVERALLSAINQTYKNSEIIVVDDSPIDYSLRSQVKELVESYRDKSDIDIIYYPHSQNLGACAARNTGMKISKGDYIAYLDDDDEWLPNKIELQRAQFTGKKIGLVYCNYYINNEYRKQKNTASKKCYTGYVYNKLLVENFVGSTSFPMIRKVALKEICGFDEKMKSAQDYDVWLRLSINWEFAYVNKPLVNYYFHKGEQISHNPRNRIDGLEKLYEKNLEGYNLNKVAYCNFLREIIPNYALDGDYKLAINNFLKVVKLDFKNIIKNTDCLLHAFVYFILRGKQWKA